MDAPEDGQIVLHELKRDESGSRIRKQWSDDVAADEQQYSTRESDANPRSLLR